MLPNFVVEIIVAFCNACMPKLLLLSAQSDCGKNTIIWFKGQCTSVLCSILISTHFYYTALYVQYMWKSSLVPRFSFLVCNNVHDLIAQSSKVMCVTVQGGKAGYKASGYI